MLLRRCAFITGAAQGLGKAFSEALLDKGAKVCLTDVQAKKGLIIESELQQKYGKENCMFMQCDVTSHENLGETFKKAVSEFGHIDLMVNNAGIADESRVVETLDINLLAAIRGSNLAVEHMRKDQGGKGGVVINVSSAAGLVGVYHTPVYCASKFGLVGFHLSMANNPHLREMCVQFGCLCPAYTDTAIIKVQKSQVHDLQEVKKLVQKMGINKVESVVDAFLQLIQSPDCNGDIVTVTAADGVKYERSGKDKWSSHL